MMHLEGLHTWGSQVTCMTFDKTDVSGYPDTISAQNVGKEVERAQNRGCLFARKWQTAPQVDLALAGLLRRFTSEDVHTLSLIHI